LQLAAEQALGEEFGAVIVIQPSTGEVLAMASNPNYDPNVFVKGIKKQAYKDLQEAPGKPLYNRTIRGQYPFGSTIKPFLALQALNTNAITPSYRISDPGYFMLPRSSHVYRDWKKGGHGTVDVVRAITISCDVFFFNVGLKMGINNIDAILNSFGFGKLTGIDLNEELPGLVPSPAWKRKAKGEAWYQGDTVISSIGQGFMLTTPLQLANGAAIMSMRGVGFRPHLLIKSVDSQRNVSIVKPQAYPPIKAKPENWDLVLKGMHQVVLPGGTAALFGPTPYLVAAKTGTAQVYSTFGKEISKATIRSLPKNLQDNTLFIAFAPVDKPEIAVAVILEHSHDAKIVARKVFDAYFQRDVPNETIQQQPAQQQNR
jgi:penicillin-binding protein 2